MPKNSQKKARVTLSKKVGCNLPVTNLRKVVQKTYGIKLTVAAAVSFTAVLDYLAAELIELTKSMCKDLNSKSIDMRHVMYAVKNDEELNQLCPGLMFNGGGHCPRAGMVMKSSVKTSKAKPSQ